MLAGIDALVLLRRDLPPLLDPADGARTVPGERGTLAQATDLPDHPIVDRGRIVGLWQYDVAAAEIVWWSFAPPDDEMRDAVAATEAYVREQLGDARSFSLDSPASREPRVAALRAAAGR